MSFSWKNITQPIIALSPMADMTDSAFCRIVKSLSNPVVFREMVSAEAVVRGNQKTLAMTDIHPSERPLIQQIFGAEPDTMAEAAYRIMESHHPEGIDINMGCPVYKIVHNFNGAALMKEPERAAAIVKAIKARVNVPVSVKIRTGWSDPNDCLTFCKILEDAGADLLTVHGRTKAQGYAGHSDWNQIAQVKKRVSIPVLANGDIHKPEQVAEALKTTGCDGVLIARGALGNPWFFQHAHLALAGQTIPVISWDERVKIISQHLQLHIEQYGPTSVTTFRKHLSWYLKGLPQMKDRKQRLMEAKTPTEVIEILQK